jgi:hypothetical protein
MKRSLFAIPALAIAAAAAFAQPEGSGSSAGSESQSAQKPKTGDYYESNENKADPNWKAEKAKEKAEGLTN